MSAHLSSARSPLSRRSRVRLGALESDANTLAARRGLALRLLLASRHAATIASQREFWFEFALADQEYRAALRRLAQFCVDHNRLQRR